MYSVAGYSVLEYLVVLGLIDISEFLSQVEIAFGLCVVMKEIRIWL
jgi:hypothetical protein